MHFFLESKTFKVNVNEKKDIVVIVQQSSIQELEDDLKKGS